MQPKILSNDVLMPGIGMGTYPLNGKQMFQAVRSAVEAGYKMFDTSHSYQNEQALGHALSRENLGDGLPNSRNLFVVTKIGERLVNGIGDGQYFFRSASHSTIKKIVESQVEQSLKSLRKEAIDCLLLHYPFPDYMCEIWGLMEDMYDQGKLRSIGVSNCRERHLEKIMANSRYKPMVNQIEVSPINTRVPLLHYCREHQIQVQVYSPLISIKQSRVAGNPILRSIAANHHKSIAQIILRWNLQQGLVPLVKSANVDRQRENIDVFDFELTEQEIGSISSLNEDFLYLPESIYCVGY